MAGVQFGDCPRVFVDNVRVTWVYNSTAEKLISALADCVGSPARLSRVAAGDHARDTLKMEFRKLIERLRSAVTPSNYTHSSQVTDIHPSDAMDVLSSERRRWAIEVLADYPPDATISVSDLAEEVAARENSCTVAELSSKQRERVYISLVQTHLVTMDGIVLEYQEDRKVVTPTETTVRLWRAYDAFRRKLNG